MHNNFFLKLFLKTMIYNKTITFFLNIRSVYFLIIYLYYVRTVFFRRLFI